MKGKLNQGQVYQSEGLGGQKDPSNNTPMDISEHTEQKKIIKIIYSKLGSYKYCGPEKASVCM